MKKSSILEMKTNSFPEIDWIPDLIKTRRRRTETGSHHDRLQGGKTDLKKKKQRKTKLNNS
jgi:hypothetical protein